MSKDKDLIERMNKKMSGADTCMYSESEVKDTNKNVLNCCKNDKKFQTKRQGILCETP